MRRLAYLAVAVAIAATGCTLNLGGDDTGDDCAILNDSNGAAIPLPELLNPETLRCETFGTYPCDPVCGGECPPTDTRPVPTWAYCYGECEGLAEADCLVATACRATYDYACYTGTGPCTALTPFLGCHGTDMTGPIQGSCVGLDAFTCSQHNDCVALHTPQCSGDTTDCWQQFVECQDEGISCWGVVLCDAVQPDCPPDTVPAVKNGCYTGACIPLADCEPAPL